MIFERSATMTYDDAQVLRALEYTARQDEQIRNDINKAIESHDKAFFAQVVTSVLRRLQRSVTDMRGFIDRAYEWFTGGMQ